MKVVFRYEYTIELTQKEFDAIKRDWVAEELQYYDHPPVPEEYDMEVAQYMVTMHHGGEFDDLIQETGFDVLEWDTNSTNHTNTN